MTATIKTETNGFQASTVEQVQQAVEEVRTRFARDARTDVAFGEPRMVGERMLIPVARVRYVFAGGAGGGDGAAAGSGSGGGSVGAVSVRPIAVIEASPEGVVIRPLRDMQAILTRAFAFVCAAVIAAFVFGGRRRRSILHIGQVAHIGNPQFKIGKVAGPRVSCGMSLPRRHR